MFESVHRQDRASGRRKLATFLAPLAGAFVAPGSILAGPSGELDTGFGDNGRVRLDAPTAADLVEIPDWGLVDNSAWNFGIGHAIAEQPDGKLLLAGEEANTGRFFVYRLNADGTVDETFGDGGSIITAFQPRGPLMDTPSGKATTVAIQPDGRIVVGGHANGSYGVPPFGNIVLLEDVGLIRLDPDGTLDSSFGDGGSVVVDLGGGLEYLSDLLLLPTGEIVIAGYTNALGDIDAAFARLTPAGRLDQTFGSGPVPGITIVRSHDNHDRPQALLRQADGSLIACGETSLFRSHHSKKVMSAARVFADGSIDTGFGSGGLALVDASPASSVARDCTTMPDGGVLLAGYSGAEGREDLQLAWLGPDGNVAAQYGRNGLATVDLGASESIQGITSLADGSIAVTGLTGTLVDYVYEMSTSAVPSRLPSEMLFAKLDRSTGELDAGFGDNGVTLVDFGRQHDTSWAYGRSIIQTADGRLVAVGTVIGTASTGYEAPDFAVARVESAGTGGPGFVGFARTYIGARLAANVVAEVRRTGGGTGPVTVEYKTVAGTAVAPRDFTESSGMLSWNDGEMTSKTIDIPVYTQENPNGSFWIMLENATGPLAASELQVAFNDASHMRLPGQVAFDWHAPDITGGVPVPSGGGGAVGIETWFLLACLAWLARARWLRE